MYSLYRFYDRHVDFRSIIIWSIVCNERASVRDKNIDKLEEM